MNTNFCYLDCLGTVYTGYFPSPNSFKWFAGKNYRNMIMSRYLPKEDFKIAPISSFCMFNSSPYNPA